MYILKKIDLKNCFTKIKHVTNIGSDSRIYYTQITLQIIKCWCKLLGNVD